MLNAGKNLLEPKRTRIRTQTPTTTEVQTHIDTETNRDTDTGTDTEPNTDTDRASKGTAVVSTGEPRKQCASPEVVVWGEFSPRVEFARRHNWSSAQ